MKSTQSQTGLSRRNFLGLLAATGLSAVAGYALFEYQPWLNAEKQSEVIWKPFETELDMSDQVYEMIRYATLAANGHNTQPWLFAVEDFSDKTMRLTIHPDYTRHLPVVDPEDRALWMSLGCALENLLIAARVTGYAAEVTYPNNEDLIHVTLQADSVQQDNLFDIIPVRQNTRTVYDGQAIPASNVDMLESLSLEEGVSLRLAHTPQDLETVLDYVNEGNLKQYANTAFKQELIDWLRFNKREALASLDGLYSKCSGNPQVPRWLGRTFVSSTKPQQQADADAEKLRSSAGAAVIASESDDKAAWVRAGQVYERLALTLTTYNLKSAFHNQPIEDGTLRSQFQTAMSLGDTKPQLLLRYGYAQAMPRSLRRPVEQVMAQA